MKIAIATDHRGYGLKENIKNFLTKEQYNIIDCGTDNEEPVDYPDYAQKICDKITNNEAKLGIVICGSGIGMSIACNKIKGIRCAKVSDLEEAKHSRNDNDANIIAISSKLDIEEAKQIILTFLTTKFSNEERHKKRIDKINLLEN